jgi:pimeloyl-ACP methyl ester carboxylesterase
MTNSNTQSTIREVAPWRWRRVTLGLIGLLSSIALGVCPSAAEAIESDPTAEYLVPQQLVIVEQSRRLNLICRGSGDPTVVLESGAGESALSWRHVQPALSGLTRTCAYDRAGYGFSDRSSHPADAQHIDDDLHRLLQAAEIRVPIVYVGHSAAGLYARLYYALHTSEIAGMVLIDPSFPHEWEAVASPLAPAQRRRYFMELASLKDRRECLRLARLGKLADPHSAVERACVDTDESGGSDALDALLRRQHSDAKYFATLVSESENIFPTRTGRAVDELEIELQGGGNLGAIPLIVLSRGNADPWVPNLTESQGVQSLLAWQHGHEELAALSNNGVHRIVENSGHFIQNDQPSIVIGAIKEVVGRVRATTP